MNSRLVYTAIALAGICCASVNQARAFHILDRLLGCRMGCGHAMGCGGGLFRGHLACGLRGGCGHGFLACHGFGLRNIFSLRHGCRFGGCGGADCGGYYAGSYVPQLDGGVVQGSPDAPAAGEPSVYHEVGYRPEPSVMADALHAFWAGDLAAAQELLHRETEAQPDGPLAFYFLALTQHRLGELEEAGSTLAIAVDLERQMPLADFGKRMERVQGHDRLWMEAARAELAR